MGGHKIAEKSATVPRRFCVWGAASKRFAEPIRIIRNHPVTGGFERGELLVDDGA